MYKKITTLVITCTHTHTQARAHMCRKTQRRFEDNKLSVRLCSGLAIRTWGGGGPLWAQHRFHSQTLRGKCKPTPAKQLLHHSGKISCRWKKFLATDIRKICKDFRILYATQVPWRNQVVYQWKRAEHRPFKADGAEKHVISTIRPFHPMPKIYVRYGIHAINFPLLPMLQIQRTSNLHCSQRQGNFFLSTMPFHKHRCGSYLARIFPHSQSTSRHEKKL